MREPERGIGRQNLSHVFSFHTYLIRNNRSLGEAEVINCSVMEISILDLSASDARLFLLRQESFCNIGLPQYFDFQKLLDVLSIAVENKKYSFRDSSYKNGSGDVSDIWDENPGHFHDVNYHFLQNKDGRFSWRPLQIINPVIYVCLVREITEENNWRIIVDRFKNDLQSNEKIKCYSVPIVNQSTETDISNTVLNWWNKMEQQSIELAMEYNYLMKTDISDCYSSIYTHSITWAMCDMEVAKNMFQKKKKTSSKDKERYKIGNSIDGFIQNMSYQQTNGIPQGSVLMDFIAELVLGYADKALSDKISKTEINEYKILRYRDDYRIFGKRHEDVIKIAKSLTEILSELNFRLNTQKTVITQDLINESIKPDKLYYLFNDYKQLEKTDCEYSLQKHLLHINKLSQEHSNSGSLQKAMNYFFKRICNWKKNELFKENDSRVLLSILTNIAYNNPKVYREYVAIVSKILSLEDETKRKDYIRKVIEKFSHLPNIGMLEVWLQRLTIKEDISKEYDEIICKYAAGLEKSIWNFDWLKSDIKKKIDGLSFVDKGKIDILPEVIEYKEIEQFNRYWL